MLRPLLSPLRLAARILFRSHLRLRWRGGPRLEFGPRGDEPAPGVDALAGQQAARELAAMQQELAEAMDEMPDLREELRHLAYFEQALRAEGLQALHTVPLDLLQRALDQFEGLVSNWSPAGLANLRSKMAVAMIERERESDDSVAPPLPSAAPRRGAAGRAAAPHPVRLNEV